MSRRPISWPRRWSATASMASSVAVAPLMALPRARADSCPSGVRSRMYSRSIPDSAVLDQEQAVDGLDLVWPGVVTGEPLHGISWVAWAPQQVTWPAGALEPGVILEQVRVIGVRRGPRRPWGSRPGAAGPGPPGTDRVTQVSVHASMIGCRLTIVPEGAPHSFAPACTSSIIHPRCGQDHSAHIPDHGSVGLLPVPAGDGP